MASPQFETTFVLYSLVGEDLEPVQESKPHYSPDTNWNAFVLPLPPAGGRVTLADVHKAFPLGNNFHFAFRCEDGAYLDVTNPESAVPFCGRKIVARVTPLDEEPSVKYLRYDDHRGTLPPSGSVQTTSVTKIGSESYGSSTAELRSHPSDDYEEFESTTYESQDEEPPASTERTPSRDKVHKEQSDWNRNIYQNEDSGYHNTDDGDRGSRFGRDDQYDSKGGPGSRQQSEWIDAGKDAQTYLRKQTEQAYDFAKKISIEDAKKNATETALKAKKWGGSLLSSISATIANASANVSKQSGSIQVGGVSVQVVRVLAEGAYAQVLLVRSSATNETFALKRILCQSQEVENDVQMELQVFRSVKHLNIMPLVEFSEARVQQGMEFYFLVPYFERGSLWDAINAARQSSSPLWPFPQCTALHLFHGICSGVLALHRAGFCHRDIKPHNILLSSSSTGEDFLAYIPVVTDFGSCAPIHVEVKSRRNSLELQDEANRKSSAPYRAPELFEPTIDTALDGQSDVWSLGCVLYTMAFGSSPFEHPREGFMKLACLNGQVSFPPEQGGMIHHRGTTFTLEFCDFIRDMLHTNPEERPSVLDALEFTEELLNDEMQRTGAVLWSRTLCKLSNNPVDNLINRVLMEDRAGEKKFIDDAYAMQWVFENKLDLVFVVVYQKILQLLYIEELLEIVKKDFVAMFPQQIANKTPVTYEAKFTKILKATELKFTEKHARKGPRSFNASKKAKAKGVTSNTAGKTALSSRSKTIADSSDDGNESTTSDGKDKNLAELEYEATLRSSKGRTMRSGARRKGKDKAAKESKNGGKQRTIWDDTKVSKKEAKALDRSKMMTTDEEEAQLREKREAYIGEMEDSDSDESSVSDGESPASGAESDSGWSFSKTRVGNFLSTMSGNKILERDDLEPVINPMHQMLISKNVASEVADELCESVITTVVGQRLESFSRISTVVRKALEAALLRILTPKKSTDVLREVLQAKAEGRAYSIVFVGVNGVGKSTSLSKVCYYLKSKGIKVMIAACDTFRSGAVEQLNQHAKVLDVELFQKGYAKDPASVAKEAIKYGADNGYDCVLIDTAGRMQNNEPLMRALAKLVSNNEPDLVLFVGEALVGNDGIDQLAMFDRALADYSDRREPHRIDGIVITKFDTIDDKVGAAVSMVYKTGQPIMFVGTGQKYTHLKKLNARTVLRHLLQ